MVSRYLRGRRAPGQQVLRLARAAVVVTAVLLIVSCEDRSVTGVVVTHGPGLPNTINYASSAPAPTGAHDFQASPIVALFDQGSFSTSYQLTVHTTPTFGRDLAAGKTRLTVVWSGPNCGATNDQGGRQASESVFVYSYSWSHPHPPCGTGNHADVTVQADILSAVARSLTCRYPGAESGTGSNCTQ